MTQGLVLGKLLFIIFLNDLIFIVNSKYMNLTLFADETTVSITSNTVADAMLKFSLHFSSIIEWFKHYLLITNWEKNKIYVSGY